MSELMKRCIHLFYTTVLFTYSAPAYLAIGLKCCLKYIEHHHQHMQDVWQSII